MYLEDKKIKYQYGLYTQVRAATPYITYMPYIQNIQDIFRYIEHIETKHRHYRQMFYIDNDFYKNKYTLECGGTYYKFLKRRVLVWDTVSLHEDNSSYNNKVINLF